MLEPADIVALEDLSARAWPARVKSRLGGWRLYATDGHTGRANTCWALQAPDRPAEEAIAAAEAWYAKRGLPPKFKTTDGATEPSELPDLLAARDYRHATETLVMTGPVGGGDPGVVLSAEPDAPFRAVLFDALYRDSADAAERLDTLRRIPRPVFFARIDVDGAPAAIGACAVEGEWGGLSVMRTRPDMRRRGLARRVVLALLGAAAEAGAGRSYLQVEAKNVGAVALYEACGFTRAYGYRYWAK